MSYLVVIPPKVRRQLDRIPVPAVRRVTAAIESLADDPRPPGCLKMQGQSDYRIRVGEYRIIYEIKDRVLTVQVIKVGHRRDVYR